MRRGPRSHNSRVDSERRGNGALNLSASFHFAARKEGKKKREEEKDSLLSWFFRYFLKKLRL
jgi:hypothetical protein